MAYFSFAAEKDNRQPNFLLFIADDCTFRDIDCYRSVDSKTPTIDNFAKEGIPFTQCFQATAMYSPTRSCLYTGLSEGLNFSCSIIRQEKEHKKYVYTVHTTKGISNGSEYYGIRPVRFEEFRYILNLNPEPTLQKTN